MSNEKKTIEAEATLTPEQKELMIEQLTALEQQIKAEIGNVADVENKIAEKIVEKDKHRFEIGRILGVIRNEKLFTAVNSNSTDESKQGKPFANIGDYAEEKFGFKKSYVSQVETAYRVLKAVTDARINEADYDLPESIVAAYTLHIAKGSGKKAVIDTETMVEILKTIKADGGAVNAKTVAELKPKSDRKKSDEAKKKIFMNHMESAKKNLKAELNKLSSKEEKQAKLDGLQEILDELKKELEAAEQE